ncbi:hypothetical protein AAS23_gp66 [Pantoea phage vB_PagS_AAS23]|uniref:Uncharacterized protein n=1 Tax=Pantoea phage vB_PagS_AAS23 TaxID=2499073 RepID=A0A3S9U844_9CAUD|nr:hypothetical protein HOU93_gp66 [Pantoea phage vB_PagS_AAS23]AZS06379.1 hypothetical protein AAS23_gp66 [Pantoea phage vB_PagS_AAS23]
MSNKPVYLRIKDIDVIQAIYAFRKELIFLRMPDGEMKMQPYKAGMANALRLHVRARPDHRYFMRVS